MVGDSNVSNGGSVRVCFTNDSSTLFVKGPLSVLVVFNLSHGFPFWEQVMDQRPCLEQATVEKCLESLWCNLQAVSYESILLYEIALAKELWYFVQVEPLVLESIA